MQAGQSCSVMRRWDGDFGPLSHRLFCLAVAACLCPPDAHADETELVISPSSTSPPPEPSPLLPCEWTGHPCSPVDFSNVDSIKRHCEQGDLGQEERVWER